MNKYTTALLLALLIVLASATLKKSFASVGGSAGQNNAFAIGGSPVPIPKDSIAAIGGSPVPIPKDSIAAIGGSPVPIPKSSLTAIGGSPVPIPKGASSQFAR